MNHSQAEKELTNILSWGEKYMGYDLVRILDGEDLTQLIQLTAERRTDEATDLLNGFVKRFLEGETGQKLVYSFLADERARQELSVLEDRAKLLYQEA